MRTGVCSSTKSKSSITSALVMRMQPRLAGLANLLFVIRSMDINIAVARVRVVFLHSMQPKNARHYQIFVWRALSGLVDRFATFEDCSLRMIMPNFLADTEFADWGLPAAFLRTKAETRRRDREAANRIFTLLNGEPLFANRNV